jgi:hypothetical protein
VVVVLLVAGHFRHGFHHDREADHPRVEMEHRP